ncbi:MAG: radical SAM protein [Desulfobacteraceae bacterium]|nr:radical SAM protein [Desulfobacteraceae bacterium]
MDQKINISTGGEPLAAVVANAGGEIFDLEGYAALGADGAALSPLTVDRTQMLPYGSELMFLPDRRPRVLNLGTGRVEVLTENPYVPGERIFPVAAFNSPGYVIAHTAAYEETNGAGFLPLFSYGAVGFHGEDFRSSVICVDTEPRQDLRQMEIKDVKKGVHRIRKTLPRNRLREHLENCALTYGCPAGKNFFLGRYEAPLPTSKACNARCLGCLSLQAEGTVPNSQDRIDFTPSAQEIAEIALAHINHVKNAVVSFGQGCEGDPLLAADVIAPAVELIRQQTSAGTININTNGSMPKVMDRLFQAGMDSVRISINSLQPECYTAYFRPHGYVFEDVVNAIDTAGRHGKHVALNYLNCPGFTDTASEHKALTSFMSNHPVNMIQWRNLNFDPVRYVHIMNDARKQATPMGVHTLLDKVREEFPNLKYGYFNPPREKWTNEMD